MPLEWTCIKLKLIKEEDDHNLVETIHEGTAARDWVWKFFPDMKVDKADEKFVILKIAGKNQIDERALEYLPVKYATKMRSGGELTYEIKPKTNGASDSKTPIRRETINTLQPEPPTYVITLTIGDIDALFEPFNSSAAQPHLERGVQQRLQALGFFYTPIAHPDSGAHAEKCWNYFRRVHEQKRKTTLGNAALLGILQEEIRGNIVTSKLIDSGEVLPSSTLPGKDDFGAIRFPGGYSHTKPQLRYWTSPPPTPFDFPQGTQRWLIEKKLRDSNEFIGKIPLIAKVEKVYADGRRELAVNENVYFQLLPPLPIPPTHDLCPPPLRNTVMDYGKNLKALKDWKPKRPPTIAGKYRASYPVFPPPPSTTPATAPSTSTTDAPPINPQDAPTPSIMPQTTQPAVRLSSDADWLQAKIYAAEAAKLGFASTQTEAADVDAKQLDYLNYQNSPAGKTDSTGVMSKQNTLTLAQNDYKKTFLYACEQQYLALQTTLSAEMKAAVRFILDQVEPKTGKDIGRRDSNKTYDPTKTYQAKGTINGEYFDDMMYELRLGTVGQLLEAPTPVAPFEIPNAGPYKFVTDKLSQIESSAQADDPQKRNASVAYGGKAGQAVAGNIFETVSRTRFNDNHSSYGSLPVAAAAAEVEGRHKHAVVCKTNAQGYAGVIFMPSSCGGDAYRLRAYVEPVSKRADNDPSAITGTLIVWRNIRIGRLLRHDPLQNNPPRTNPSDPTCSYLPQSVVDLFNNAPNGGSSDEDQPYKDAPYGGSWLETAKAFSYLQSSPPVVAIKKDDPLEPIYLESDLTERKLRYRPIDHQFISVWENFRRCYCEIICDYAAAEPLTQTMLDEARRQMITALNAQNLRYTGPQKKGNPSIVPQKINIDWDNLIFCDVESPYLLNARHYQDYNNRIKKLKIVVGFAELPGFDDDSTSAATPPRSDIANCQILGNADANTIGAAVFAHGIQPIVESLTDGGVYPGFTIIQIPHGDTWDHRNLGLSGMFTSGWSGTPRGILVFYNDRLHHETMCYSGSSNVAHELGHELGLTHQPPEPANGDPRSHESSPSNPNQTPKVGETNCVMSYYGSYGEFCGKCVLSLRGWKISMTLWSNPDRQEGEVGQTDGI